MKRKVFFASVLVAACCAVVSGCQSHESVPGLDEVIDSCEVVIGDVPFASDETFRAFINAEAAGQVTRDDQRAPVLLMPRLGMRIGVSIAPTFSWRPKAVVRGPASGPSNAKLADCHRAPHRRGWRALLRSAFTLERAAYAHCPAFNGENFFFRLSQPGVAGEPEQPVYAAVLSITSFAPNTAIWTKKVKPLVGKKLTLTLMRAVFSDGKIIEGPFAPTTPLVVELSPE